MPALHHAQNPNYVHEAGVSTTAGQYGWFAPQLSNQSLDDEFTYKIFLNRSHQLYDDFVVEDERLGLILQSSE